MKRVLRILWLGAVLFSAVLPTRVLAGKNPSAPKIVYDKKVTNTSQKVKLTTSVKKGVIYYTTDGSTPVKGEKGTKKYKKKITVSETTTVKARVYKGKKKSKVASVKLIVLKPVKIKSIALVKGGVKLKWKKAKDAEGYRVYRKKTKDGSWKSIEKITSKKTTSFLDKDVDWSSKYYYYISAYRGKVKSKHKDNTESISTDHDHDYEDGEVLEKPTCTKKGKQEQVCSICGKKKTVKLPKRAHEIEVYTEGRYTLEVCENCGTQVRKYLAEEIPDYWNDEITEAVDQAKARGDLPGFAYFTDTHWEKNAGRSPAILNYVTEQMGFRFAAFGGDAITSYHPSPEDAKEELADFLSRIRVPLFSTTGNHDWNSSSNPDESAWLSSEEVYEAMYQAETSFASVDGGALYSRTDDTEHKIRYLSFCYDERHAVGQEILDWIRARVTELPEDWNVVLFSHAYWTYKVAGKTPAPLKTGEELAEELLSIQRESDACIAFWLVGHIHRDMAELLGDETGSLWVISSNCDACKLSKKWGGWKMKKGTTTEQAIDLVQLDTDEQRVFFTRIGAGEDRDFTWSRPVKQSEPEPTPKETSEAEETAAVEQTEAEETTAVEQTEAQETAAVEEISAEETPAAEETGTEETAAEEIAAAQETPSEEESTVPEEAPPVQETSPEDNPPEGSITAERIE